MDNCCICSNNDLGSVKINEITSKNTISLKSQLESLVPEVTWLEDYLICYKCQDNLNLIQEFRTQCLESQKLREMEIKIEDPTIMDDDPSPKSPLTQKPNKIDLDESPVDPNLIIKQLESNKIFLETPPEALEISNVPNDRPKICIYCGKGFKDNRQLGHHEKIHLNLREFECKLCNTRYNTYKNLYTHNKVKHTDPIKWRFQCGFCNKRFPIKSNYDIHIKRHNNAREFACHLCDKKFNEKYTLKDHLLIHSNIREFACDLCDCEYRRRRDLNIHKFKKHNIECAYKVPVISKNFACEICGKKFAVNIRLQKHLLTHKKRKLLNCSLCNDEFNDGNRLMQHLKEMHNTTQKDEDN